MQLPGNSRALLRDAVRKLNPSVDMLNGMKINDLPKDHLIRVAEAMGINVASIVRAAGAAPIGTVTRALVDGDDAVNDDEVAEEIAQIEDSRARADDIAVAASTLRRELSQAMVEGDFDTVTAKITNLITEARKPAEIKIETVYVDVAPSPDGSHVPTVPRPACVPGPVAVDTWGKLFQITGPNASKKINIFAPTAATPKIDTKYNWPEGVTIAALSAMGRGRNCWAYGPAGTGKTSFWEQLAARTGRPFVLIPCDDTTEAPELVGMTVPHNGGVRWQDGVLTAAMRTPHAIVLVDEPTVARPGAIMVLQSVLASGSLSIKETGEVVRCAEGVRFAVADNTNGTGGGTAEGYEGTRRMNRATLDRFASFLRFDYMRAQDEAQALVAHTGCTSQLADILVECASLTRKARITHALGLRRLIAWAEALTDGLDPRIAFEFTILNSCARDDKEPIEQACALGLDKTAVKRALAGKDKAIFTKGPAQGETADFAG